MSVLAPRPSRRLLFACLTVALTAGSAAAGRDAPEILFPVPPAGVTGAAASAAAGTPPVLRVQPLIELSWAEVFRDRVRTLREALDDDDEGLAPSRLPSGPMYRRDI